MFLHSNRTLTKIMLLKRPMICSRSEHCTQLATQDCNDEAWKLQKNCWGTCNQCSRRHLPFLGDPETPGFLNLSVSSLLVCLAFAGGGCKGRSKDLIPGKCFLLFQDHGLAHVQPQTQCTIAGAAREEKAERGNKKRKTRKAFRI